MERGLSAVFTRNCSGLMPPGNNGAEKGSRRLLELGRFRPLLYVHARRNPAPHCYMGDLPMTVDTGSSSPRLRCNASPDRHERLGDLFLKFRLELA